MDRVIARFWQDEQGATAVEYGLMAAIIGLGIISSIEMFPETLNGMLGSVVEAFGEEG
ncbi:MAG: Flp family type IVb pilin [Hyphomicrobium sp.]|uniref:Flp family type IVb pilin n=1 Tax=Hyphomicrobium sp. TaxID=82 RepID=UPI003D0B34A4